MQAPYLCSRFASSFARPRIGAAIARSRMISTSTDGLDVKFGPFPVTKQVFLTTPHCYGLVNLKPIVPGHVLICPLKPHRRLTDLSPTETTDLFTTVQLTQRMLARTYFKTPEPEAGSFTIAVQDGQDAGQTVAHVHVHVIPRIKDDMGEGAAMDEIYVKMADEEGNVGGALWDRETAAGGVGQRPKPGGGMPRIEDDDRSVRTAEEMHEEADRYKATLREMGAVSERGGSESDIS